jgi:hypothetical protein
MEIPSDDLVAGSLEIAGGEAFGSRSQRVSARTA